MGLFGDFFDFDDDGESSMLEIFLGLDALGFFDTNEDNKDDEYEYEDEEDDDQLF